MGLAIDQLDIYFCDHVTTVSDMQEQSGPILNLVKLLHTVKILSQIINIGNITISYNPINIIMLFQMVITTNVSKENKVTNYS